MHLILGGTGHVGSAAARVLVQRDEPVTIITRDGQSPVAKELQRQGVEIACADDWEAFTRSPVISPRRVHSSAIQEMEAARAAIVRS